MQILSTSCCVCFVLFASVSTDLAGEIGISSPKKQLLLGEPVFVSTFGIVKRFDRTSLVFAIESTDTRTNISGFGRGEVEIIARTPDSTRFEGLHCLWGRDLFRSPGKYKVRALMPKFESTPLEVQIVAVSTNETKVAEIFASIRPEAFPFHLSALNGSLTPS